MIYENVELYNVHELLESDGAHVLQTQVNREFVEGEDDNGKWFTRIPNDLRLGINDFAQLIALQTPGCEIRFNLKSDTGKVVLKCVGCSGIVEVYQGSFLVGWYVVGQSSTEIPIVLPDNIERLNILTKKNNLPFDANLIRVVLPWRPVTRLINIEGDFEFPQPSQTPVKKCLFYGSSITHGSLSVRPTGSYPSRVTQLLGVDIINLGFSGCACLERKMADHIAGKSDWDFAVLELGINVLNSIDTDEFEKRAAYFLKTLTKLHPDKLIFCIDIFTCTHDFEGNDKISKFRSVIRDVVKEINTSKLIHVCGTDILRSTNGLTVDLVHPSPLGHEEMARNLSKLIQSKLCEGGVI